jgi:predicted GTPase
LQNKVLGILGTSKNTGKTTTTSALLEIANNKNLSVGITSIGYDGEDIDNITGLPKPRIFARKGILVATTNRCLKAGTAKIEKLEETSFSTPLGNIVIGKIIEEGLIVVAGPNKGNELSVTLDKLKILGNELILVDGALNRIVPLMKTDALILTTGAARNINIDFLVKEIQCISSLFELPKI